MNNCPECGGILATHANKWALMEKMVVQVKCANCEKDFLALFELKGVSRDETD